MFSQPALNASLNGISALLLAGGYAAIRAGKRDVRDCLSDGLSDLCREGQLRLGQNPRRKIPLKLRSIFLPESRRHQGSRYRGADRLACAGFREYHVPEIDIGIDECNSHESSFALFPQGSHDTI